MASLVHVAVVTPRCLSSCAPSSAKRASTQGPRGATGAWRALTACLAQAAPHLARARAARGTCACPQSAEPRPAAPPGAAGRSKAPRAAPTPAAPCAAGPPSTAPARTAGRPARRRRARPPRFRPRAGPRSTSAWAARTTVRHQPKGGQARFALLVQVQARKGHPGRRSRRLLREQE